MTSLYEHLAGSVMDWIVRSSDERRLDKGEVLIAEGQKNDTLYVPLEGVPTTLADKWFSITAQGRDELRTNWVEQ